MEKEVDEGELNKALDNDFEAMCWAEMAIEARYRADMYANEAYCTKNWAAGAADEAEAKYRAIDIAKEKYWAAGAADEAKYRAIDAAKEEYWAAAATVAKATEDHSGVLKTEVEAKYRYRVIEASQSEYWASKLSKAIEGRSAEYAEYAKAVLKAAKAKYAAAALKDFKNKYR